HRSDQECRSNFLSRDGDACNQARQQSRLDELRHQLLPHTPRPPKECQQCRRQDQQQPKNLERAKTHGKISDWRLAIGDLVMAASSLQYASKPAPSAAATGPPE